MFELLTTAINVTALDAMYFHACCGQDGYEPCGFASVHDDSNSVNVSTVIAITIILFSVDALHMQCPQNVLTGLPYPFPSNILSRDAVTSNDLSIRKEYELIDNSFHCEALPNCQVSCDGPEKDLLAAATTKCACVGEWFMHASLLRSIVLVVLFVTLNLARWDK